MTNIPHYNSKIGKEIKNNNFLNEQNLKTFCAISGYLLNEKFLRSITMLHSV